MYLPFCIITSLRTESVPFFETSSEGLPYTEYTLNKSMDGQLFYFHQA